jgi:hypothetical protein
MPRTELLTRFILVPLAAVLGAAVASVSLTYLRNSGRQLPNP